jgi:hypothetical protein
VSGTRAVAWTTRSGTTAATSGSRLSSSTCWSERSAEKPLIARL